MKSNSKKWHRQAILLMLSLSFSLVLASMRPPAYALGNQVELMMKVNQEVVQSPNLYEHLRIWISVGKTSDVNSSKTLILENHSMLDLNRALNLGQFMPGETVYVFVKIKLDGVETPNDYQASSVRTGYTFTTKSTVSLTKLRSEILSGNVFKNMTNLNPGDDFSGVIAVNVGIKQQDGGGSGGNDGDDSSDGDDDDGDVIVPVVPETPGNITPDVPTNEIIPIKPEPGETPGVPGEDVEDTVPSGNTSPGGGRPPGIIPKTFDASPIDVFMAFSVVSGILLLIQVLLLVRSKHRS